MSTELNDVQSRLNPSVVDRVVTPTTLKDLQEVVRCAEIENSVISIAGHMHSMGGQQFCDQSLHLDLRNFDRVLRFDTENGHIDVESGIAWPALIKYLSEHQNAEQACWGISQKQTGVDNVTIGGSRSSNIHGRGLHLPPFIHDIESFTLINAGARMITCSRTENAELFSLVVGGYGMFGIVAHVRLRLAPRVKVQRQVEVIAVGDLIEKMEGRIKEGALYGDCQYSIHVHEEISPHPGILSSYIPVLDSTKVADNQKQLSEDDWGKLYRLARTDKQKAFEAYAQYYLNTSGQVYWSDTHQLSNVFKGYQDAVDVEYGTEMITEVYVTKDAFVPFMAAVRADFLKHEIDLIYGTIRLIKKDTESFLAWAKDDYICIVCNLHVEHTSSGIEKAKEDFRRIIDKVIQYGGCFYLTYHKWATKEQITACYPQFVDFLKLKRTYDPSERFQSNWYRHYKEMFNLNRAVNKEKRGKVMGYE